ESGFCFLSCLSMSHSAAEAASSLWSVFHFRNFYQNVGRAKTRRVGITPEGVTSFPLSQKFSQRLPVVRIPSRTEMIKVPLGKSGVIENEFGARVLRFQFNLDQRISPFRKLLRQSPSLHDPPVRNQFNVPSDHQPAKHRERSANLRLDLGRCPGERREILGTEQRLVNALRSGLVIDLLMQRRAILVRLAAGRRRFVFRSLAPGRNAHARTATRDDDAGPQWPPRRTSECSAHRIICHRASQSSSCCPSMETH